MASLSCEPPRGLSAAGQSVSADFAVLGTVGEKMMDGPGYSEGKNG